jgi:ABC-type phosphate transport system substrate-binding protein
MRWRQGAEGRRNRRQPVQVLGRNPRRPSGVRKSLAFIPGTKHGTREVFEEKVWLAGCEETGAMEAIDGQRHGRRRPPKRNACVRTDGKSVDIDGDYTETLARMTANPNGIGVFGLSFYENNTDKLQVATMGGISPSVESIASGEYPVSRPLFFYVKKAHIGVIPGLKEYIEFFVSDEIAGPDGPLAAYGLVSDPELAKTQGRIADGLGLITAQGTIISEDDLVDMRADLTNVRSRLAEVGVALGSNVP